LFFFAACTLFVISLVAGVSVFSVSIEEFPWFVFLALVPTMIGHNIFYYLIKTLSTTTVAAVPLGEPVVSSLGALAFFGEPIGLAVILGGGITLFGVFLVVRFGD
jgi:drug/metabolite transporter (DMT)-like permease